MARAAGGRDEGSEHEVEEGEEVEKVERGRGLFTGTREEANEALTSSKSHS